MEGRIEQVRLEGFFAGTESERLTGSKPDNLTEPTGAGEHDDD